MVTIVTSSIAPPVFAGPTPWNYHLDYHVPCEAGPYRCGLAPACTQVTDQSLLRPSTRPTSTPHDAGVHRERSSREARASRAPLSARAANVLARAKHPMPGNPPDRYPNGRAPFSQTPTAHAYHASRTTSLHAKISHARTSGAEKGRSSLSYPPRWTLPCERWTGRSR